MVRAYREIVQFWGTLSSVQTLEGRMGEGLLGGLSFGRDKLGAQVGPPNM